MRKQANNKRPSSPWLAPTLIFWGAAGVRLLYLAQLSNNPDLLIPLFDAQGFVARADQWIRGQGLSAEVYAFSLLYHLFLSACFFITDASLAFARGVQALLGAATCALLASATERMFGRRTGIIAGVIAAFYGPAIVLTTELMPATLEAFWCVAVLACAIPRESAGAQKGISLALALLGGLGFLLAPRFGLAWLLVFFITRGTPTLPPKWKSYAAIAFAAPLLIAFLLLNGELATDVTARRWAEDLYLGNSGNLCQTLGMRPGPEYSGFQDAIARDADAAGVSATRYFLRQTKRAATTHPLLFIKGLGAKTLHLLSGRELPGALDIRAASDSTHLGRLLLGQLGRLGVPFALLLTLAAAGLALARDRIHAEYIVLIIALALFLILTRITAPTRLAWAFLLVPLAGQGLSSLFESSRPKWSAGIAAVIAFCIATIPGPFCVEASVGQAEQLRAIGGYFMQRYEIGRAATYFERALASDPNDAPAWNGIGIARQLDGKLADAATAFDRAIALQPDYALALFNLASVQSALGQRERAVATLRRGLALQPRNGQAHNDLGLLLLAQGNPQEAIPHFEQARELNPTVLDPRINLAAAQQAAGDPDAARAELEATLKQAPLDPRVHVALGFLNLRSGSSSAEANFLIARNLSPQSPEPLYGVAAILLQQNRIADAHRAFAEAKRLDKNEAARRWLTPEEIEALR